MVRLDKALADMGIGTRNEIKKLCRSGRVCVNGEVIKKSETKVDETDELSVDGIVLHYEKYTYLMMNKPEGVISATESDNETVLDLIYDPVKGLFPCGRLDKDTTGLLLITNDGDLAHRLLSPKHHVDKEYEVQLDHVVSDADIAAIAKGISEGGDDFLPAEYKKLTETSGRIILHEGKFHEVKRIFLALGNEVTALKRVRMKDLILDESLEPGEYRPLTEEELKGLLD